MDDDRPTIAFVIEIEVGPDVWKPVGRLYRDRECAQSWQKFVKKAWYAKRARVVKVELPARTL